MRSILLALAIALTLSSAPSAWAQEPSQSAPVPSQTAAATTPAADQHDADELRRQFGEIYAALKKKKLDQFRELN